MQLMKRLVFSVLIVTISAGMAWSGERGYQLVASRDSKLCARVLEAFREDVDDRGRLRYRHEMFRQIVWKPVELKGQGPKMRRCSTLDKALMDLDNDGQQDLVVKTTFCMKGPPSDSLYVFPADSPALDQASWQDLSPLLATNDKFERTGGTYPLTSFPMKNDSSALTALFAIHPFLLDGVTYVSLTDARGEWIVIARYLRGERFEDLCYLRDSRF
ncbi:MAG: hypothetical protein EHM80_05850 [Nitrospiraceae bacterium]|nr:MAG: hypothetical protein EHM80_05850 [Nitrospiraceae bacterium]